MLITFCVLKFRYKLSNWSIYSKAACISITLEVSKFLISKLATLTLANIKDIFVTSEVSKEDTSKLVNELQSANINLISFTDDVFTSVKLIDVILVQLKNIAYISLIKEVLYFAKSASNKLSRLQNIFWKLIAVFVHTNFK